MCPFHLSSSATIYTTVPPLPIPPLLLCLPHKNQRRVDLMYVRPQARRIRPTVGSLCLFTPSFASSPTSDTKLKGWNRQWSEFLIGIHTIF